MELTVCLLDSLNSNRVVILKYLFGLSDDTTRSAGFHEENMNYVADLAALFSSKITADSHLNTSDRHIMFQVYNFIASLFSSYFCGLSCNCLLIPDLKVSKTVESLASVLQGPVGSGKVDDSVLPSNDILDFLKTHLTLENSVDRTDDPLNHVGLGDKFLWECPETLPDRLAQANVSAKRKQSSMDVNTRRTREGPQAEMSAQNAFQRGATQSTVSSGPTRRDAFRQRKPNTSRPPSMHVDDYVARERNVEGVTNVITVPRAGSTGGRPPSIHVDEFMARQRERQNTSVTIAGEAVGHPKNVPADPKNGEKLNKSKQLKTDLDDDLQGIDIVFDGEESDPDDKLPFPQPDDNLQQPAPVIVEQSSPHSIVEETGSDVVESGQFSHMGTPLGSNVDENVQSEFSSKMSVSRPDMPLTRESSVSSDRKYVEQSDESKNVFPTKTFDSTVVTNSSGFPASLYNNLSASPMQLPGDSRMASQNFYLKNSPQHGGNITIVTGSQGLYDPRYLSNQPPLPPMPPPPTALPVTSHASDSISNQSSPFVNSPADPQRPVLFQVRSYVAYRLFSSLLLLHEIFLLDIVFVSLFNIYCIHIASIFAGSGRIFIFHSVIRFEVCQDVCIFSWWT